VAFDDSVGEGQSETGAHTNRLRRKERVEDATLYRGRNSGPIVVEYQSHPTRSRTRLDANRSLVFDRIAGIDQQIQEDLIELPRVALHPRQGSVVALDDDAILESRFHQGERTVDLLVQIDLLQFRLIHA
jgi:hypothetical protein